MVPVPVPVPAPCPCEEPAPAPRHGNYLGDGREGGQPAPLARRAREADGSAPVPPVALTAAQNVQSTGNGITTPVRHPCKEWHCQTKLQGFAAQSPQIPGLGTERPEPKDNTDHPVPKLVLAEHLSLTVNFISCWCIRKFNYNFQLLVNIKNIHLSLSD